MTTKCAVIILNWNGEQLLADFLSSVTRHTNPALARVIVADNHSTDGSVSLLQRRFPDVERLLLDRNHGFAGGYNRAINQVDAEYIVLLNSDVEVTTGWLEPLVALLDRERDVAAVQPKIRSWRHRDTFEYAGACGGYIDRLGFPFCRGRILDTVERDTGQYDTPARVFWATGAALCIRRHLYLEAGGLDETFFAHMEEIDLCWRLHNRGHAIMVEPASTVYHLGGGTLPVNHPRKLFLNYRNNLWMLRKNLPAGSRRRVLLQRTIVDAASACIFLLKGEVANARSLLRAYAACRASRPDTDKEARPRLPDTVYRRAILWDYFARRRAIFSKLPPFDKPSP
ncbi:MAG: glycosyltransferase family 2 protein [Odoribacteraceae bacterium]|jgi:GT2 family glycosyltransferase|nr:glycosyltransferase family 2 protein [Odoribacteraceae bacterium]